MGSIGPGSGLDGLARAFFMPASVNRFTVAGIGDRCGEATINCDLTTAADAFARHGKPKMPASHKKSVVVCDPASASTLPPSSASYRTRSVGEGAAATIAAHLDIGIAVLTKASATSVPHRKIASHAGDSGRGTRARAASMACCGRTCAPTPGEGEREGREGVGTTRVALGAMAWTREALPEVGDYRRREPAWSWSSAVTKR
jgi:hypothetical protein